LDRSSRACVLVCIVLINDPGRRYALYGASFFDAQAFDLPMFLDILLLCKLAIKNFRTLAMMLESEHSTVRNYDPHIHLSKYSNKVIPQDNRVKRSEFLITKNHPDAAHPVTIHR